MANALFELDGERFVPTELTTGPWDPLAQHGGPPAALLTRSIERTDSQHEMQITRTTFELLRPVPLTPLTVRTEVLRPGRRVQLIGASLFTEDETEVARATSLRIRDAELPLPPELPSDDMELPGPEHGDVLSFPGESTDHVAFHTHANEIRFIDGGFDRPGPATGWVHLSVPVVAGEETTPSMRLVAAADFGNGFSWVLPRADWIFINPDLTVHAHRAPEAEWIGLRSRTSPGPHGSGTAESELFDRRGRLGRAVQSLYLDRL